MMMKPYPDYKDSGVAWLGQIPAHWDVLQNRALFKERITKGRIDEELLSVTMKEGIIKQKELLSESSKKDSSNEDKSNYKLVMPDDLAYNKMRMWQGAVGASKFQGLVSPAYVVIQPKSDVNSWYYHYLFRIPAYTNESYRHSYGICDDQLSLRYEDFKVMSSPKPPIEEQQKIVRFLDDKCEKIDRFIASKQRMAALLREQKQAVISAAVTGKLNACVSCAPCGSCVKNLNANDANGARDAKAWLGEIPCHWEVASVKNFYNIQLGKMLQPEKKFHDDISFPYLKALHVQWFRVEQDSLPEMWGQPSDIEKYGVKSGDLLVCEGGEGGRAAIITNISTPCIIQNALHRVRSKTRAELKFLQYVMYAISSLGWFDAICNRATIAHFTKEKFGSLKIPMPPLEEQQAIIQYIEKESHKIDTIIARTEREIALMQEYRARLIADVVTGQIDVREKILTQTAQMTQEPQTL